MVPLDYVFLRFIRRHLPARWMQWFLRHQIGIRPGLETRAPEAAAERYVRFLTEAGQDLSDRTALVFGYGGTFGLAVALLRMGARRVGLCDPYARPDRDANRALAEKYSQYLHLVDGEVVPNQDSISLIHEDIRDYATRADMIFELVLSSSVFEHLEDVDSVTSALTSVTSPRGYHLHFIDLRDHYFKYPFEMLCYSERIWRTFLNPTSNLNRLRVWQFGAAFRANFEDVRWEALYVDMEAFHKTRSRIHPEFLTGNDQVDAVTQIVIHASKPLPLT